MFVTFWHATAVPSHVRQALARIVLQR